MTEQEDRERLAADNLYATTILCNTCRYQFVGTATCVAFLQGIPQEILTGQFDHRLAHPDDRGVQYKSG